MKKILCVLLSLIIISGCAATAFAADLVEDVTEYPIIFVPGYASTHFYCIDENGNEKREMYIMHFIHWLMVELKKYGSENKSAMDKHLAKYSK